MLAAEETTSLDSERFVTEESEHTFRCMVPSCKKLFSSRVYWSKHFERRHPLLVTQSQGTVRAYILYP